MRVLVIGSGGREHALAWKLLQSPLVDTVFVAPGNGGTARDGAVNVPIAVDDIEGLVRFAQQEQISLVVPGPELALTLGIVDAMAAVSIPCFGPDRYCAQLEGSKAFAKRMMERAGVPTARCAIFDDLEAAKAYVREQSCALVVKADGLAAGKGVVVAQTSEEALAALDAMMGEKTFGDAGNTVVIEECLIGEEASFLCLCDGEHAIPLPSAQDHKAVYDGDKGPNTGGMGAYSPAPILPATEAERIADMVIRPILRAFKEEGHPFVGILYAGLMMTANGPKVLEYNTRFGDPECQPLLMRLDGDLVPVLQAALQGKLQDVTLAQNPKSALGVVMCAEGYPGSYPKGMVITGFEEADTDDVKVFHSGSTAVRDNTIVSSGGRVLCVTALGETLQEAQDKAYAAVEKLHMEQAFWRRDIGSKGIRRLEQSATEK